MIQQNFPSSQSFQICEAHKERLIQETQELTIELKKVSEVNKYTTEIKKKMAKLEQKIRSNQDDLEKVEIMLTFVPGDWVRNGTTRPGQITELRIVGRIPEVQVLWWNNTASVPENPRHLKLVSRDDLRYVWNGQRCPKLIRKIDHEECEDLEILNEIYQELESFQATLRPAQGNAEEINLKRVYCRKRLKLLQAENSLSSEIKENNILNFCHRKPELQTIAIVDINRSGQTQQRIGLNPEIVTEYREAMLNGAIFPPVTLKYDGENYWLVDGFHTTEAVWSIGKQKIEAFVSEGSLRDAILDSVGVNSDHGLRRSNADKHRAVMTLLQDEEWRQWSNREIARRCKVSEFLVRSIKNDLTAFKRSDNPKNDNSIIALDFQGDNPIKYIDKYGNESEMSGGNARVSRAYSTPLLSLSKDTDSFTDSERETKEQNCPNLFQEKPEKENKIAQKMALFQVGQMVVIDSDRSDQRLVGFNRSNAVITKINPASLNLRIWKHSLENVAPQDVKPLSEFDTVAISFNQKLMARLMLKFDSMDQIIDYVAASL